MSAHLFRTLDLLARHRALASWAAGGLAAMSILLGIALGAARFATPAFAGLGVSGPSVDAAAATVVPGRASLQGVILKVRPQGFRLLTANGRTVTVLFDPNTAVRKGGRPLDRNALHRGQRVVALGKVTQNGRLRARAVAVRSEVKLPARRRSALAPTTTPR